jgi:hypothetical protein
VDAEHPESLVPLSPIELLLPNGVAERAAVYGDACPPALAPRTATHESAGAGTALDLVVLAPSSAQQRDRGWARTAARTVAEQLAPTGIAYVVPAGARRLRRALRSAGIAGSATLLHIPSVAHGRHVVQLGTAAERYALSGRLPMSRAKRLAAATALRVPRLAVLGPTGTVSRRPDAPPLGKWLFELGEPVPAGSTLVSVNETREAAVLHRFPMGESLPDAVAKVSPGAASEVRALRDVAPTARGAGARIPDILAAGELGPTPYVLLSALPGRSAALLLAQGQVSARQLQEELAAWLERWARSAATARHLSPDDLQRFVLTPAAELGPRLAGSYHDHLRSLCAEVSGKPCPDVPAHGDLTVANVLLGSAGLAIVDWEKAERNSLPLVDFLYAATDALAAEEAYADRLGAFSSCFAPDGAHAAAVGSLLRRLAAAASIDASVQELCFHACWLHHAANEARRSPADVGPFGAIVQAIARDPTRYRLAT